MVFGLSLIHISGAEGSKDRPVSDAANGSDCKYIGYAGGSP